jgi:hypothetical protein
VLPLSDHTIGIVHAKCHLRVVKASINFPRSDYKSLTPNAGHRVPALVLGTGSKRTSLGTGSKQPVSRGIVNSPDPAGSLGVVRPSQVLN